MEWSTDFSPPAGMAMTEATKAIVQYMADMRAPISDTHLLENKTQEKPFYWANMGYNAGWKSPATAQTKLRSGCGCFYPSLLHQYSVICLKYRKRPVILTLSSLRSRTEQTLGGVFLLTQHLPPSPPYSLGAETSKTTNNKSRFLCTSSLLLSCLILYIIWAALSRTRVSEDLGLD